MFKKLLLVALIAIGAQAQNYCADQKLRCLTAATTRPESEACNIREQACTGSKIWVTECPKAAPAVESNHHHHHHEKKKDKAPATGVSFMLKAAPRCAVPCNNNWIICDEMAITGADQAACQIRKQACTASTKCTWVPMFTAV